MNLVRRSDFTWPKTLLSQVPFSLASGDCASELPFHRLQREEQGQEERSDGNCNEKCCLLYLFSLVSCDPLILPKEM